jgi:hypothetical protein
VIETSHPVTVKAMPEFLKVYGDAEGPLGFPMKDADARALDSLLETLPEVDYRRAVVEKATTELSPGERADVSWITTEALDRHRDVVLAAGMDDGHFRANPIVTMAHDYTRPPVGRSLWRRKVRDGSLRGVKAKTLYPTRPDDWPTSEPWMPDRAFALVRAGLLSGKSIGFLTLEASAPADDEVRRNPEWAGAARVVRKWLLLEYCCHWLPVNPEAVVEQVSKGAVCADDLKALGIEPPAPPASAVIAFTTEADVERAVRRRLEALDPRALAERAVQDAYDRLRGRV